MTDDAHLIAKARNGDLDAFEQIVLMHQGAVRVYLSRFLTTSDRVDDVAQETFLAAHRRLPSYQGRSSLRVWLIGIARLEAIDHLRSASRRRRRETDRAVFEWVSEVLGEERGSTSYGTGCRARACEPQLPPRR